MLFVKDLEMLPSGQASGLDYISFFQYICVLHMILAYIKCSSITHRQCSSQKPVVQHWYLKTLKIANSWQLWLCVMEFLLSPGKHRNLLRSLGTIWAPQVWPCQSFETVWEIILEILLWPGYYFFFRVTCVVLYLLERDH